MRIDIGKCHQIAISYSLLFVVFNYKNEILTLYRITYYKLKRIYSFSYEF